MKALQIHNYYRFRGGEDAMFENICGMLRENGHEVVAYEMRSESIEGFFGKLSATVSGVYSREARAAADALLVRERPDLAHAHNLYPLISPSVLSACAARGVPVVMRCPNYRLVCPTAVHLRKGRRCELCRGGREYWCALTNCRGNMVESAVMATRSYLVRSLGLITDTVSMFVPPSECVRQRLLEAGIPASRIRVIPNTVAIPETACDAAAGSYVAFAGRLSEEKGVHTLVEAARMLPAIPFRIAGDGALLASLKAGAPENVAFIGHLGREALGAFYAGARIGVVPSIWLEAFGLVAGEAMAQGLPVVASRIGALPEIVDDGVTGTLFAAGDADDLATKLDAMWGDPLRCRAMGLAGREKVKREYARSVYFARLMRVYEEVLGVECAARIPRVEPARSA
ncbi:MAG: glycosyltransferase family 4 protein [Candidatus Hydrogenedentes bacterium]|nr:glycosyltransferase family 4 protein [Candidatus Hydrogenedentota bacterium]